MDSRGFLSVPLGATSGRSWGGTGFKKLFLVCSSSTEQIHTFKRAFESTFDTEPHFTAKYCLTLWFAMAKVIRMAQLPAIGHIFTRLSSCSR